MDNKKIEEMGKASRRSAMMSLAGLLIVIFSLIYSSYKLYVLQQISAKAKAELEVLEGKKNELTTELQQKQQQIAEADKKLEFLNSALSNVGTSDVNLAKQAIDKAIASNPEAAKIVPRIYIHIREERQRRQAKQIVEKLQEKGYVIPGIERLVNKGPNRTQLRYFRSEEKDGAEAIVNILKSLQVNDAEAEYIKGYENSTQIRPRHYEIWFGPNSLAQL